MVPSEMGTGRFQAQKGTGPKWRRDWSQGSHAGAQMGAWGKFFQAPLSVSGANWKRLIPSRRVWGPGAKDRRPRPSKVASSWLWISWGGSPHPHLPSQPPYPGLRLSGT